MEPICEMDVGQRLLVGVADDEARRGLLDRPGRREAATAIRHHVLPLQSRVASKITKAPGMTRANANWKNGVKCMCASPDVVEGSEAVTKKAPS